MKLKRDWEIFFGMNSKHLFQNNLDNIEKYSENGVDVTLVKFVRDSDIAKCRPIKVSLKVVRIRGIKIEENYSIKFEEYWEIFVN